MTSILYFDRRKLLGTSGLLIPALLPAFHTHAAQTSSDVVETAEGRLVGVRSSGISVFKGVPYAGSVSGQQRFKAAPPLTSWTGIRDASRLGPPSIQPPNQTSGIDEPTMAEDCLFLNVWTPATDGRKRPVMVYQHGGGFVTGSAGARMQDGSNLARDHDVVVVAANHRLGIMGYLYLGGLLGPEYAGNQGLTDLVAALSWVKRNIAAFGGDPDNVMIFGESGGGGKTACLYTMPAAASYFNKASIESPVGPGHLTPDHATQLAREAMRRLDISDPRQLLTMPASLLLQAQMGANTLAPGTLPPPGTPAGERPISFGPIVDGDYLPAEPFADTVPAMSRAKPLIVGGCKDETVFFNRLDRSAFQLDEARLKARLSPTLGSRTDAWIETFKHSRPAASPSQLFFAITTARPWRAHALHIAEAKAAQHAAPVYSYILDYRSPQFVEGTDYPQGSPHASDIAMKFDTANLRGEQSPARLRTARTMSEMWATFARDGVPGALGQPSWPAFTIKERATMIISDTCRIEMDPEGIERRFWQSENGADQFPLNR
ncbi:carboxylesterase/lipase family protein [Novosphingobium rosa]|uniref:carboxylesterase/lipase family protein n=1 Tax=Novosphingobium rosa TaxID=76978 RepID=UPI000ABB771A|nr:carboxylesterase family protein [Novosphingobium rosa]